MSAESEKDVLTFHMGMAYLLLSMLMHKEWKKTAMVRPGVDPDLFQGDQNEVGISKC